tara:strand:+ start:5187 stop:5885 length:699 start_codon:yes stop_codon:yes gene_type:complete
MNFKNNINKIEKILGYKYKKKENLINSIVHPSYFKEKKKKNENSVNEFERLEFLGDRVLGICISSIIYYKYKDFDEGNLTKKLSYLVQKDFLYKIALELKIENLLFYSYKRKNSIINKSILADSVESLIGGIFVDGGYTKAFKIISKIWGPFLDIEESIEKDPKTKLQELSQKKFKILPQYKLIKKQGPSHSPNFTVSLKALNMKVVKATGNSKREAEKNAAKIVLDLSSEN